MRAWLHRNVQSVSRLRPLHRRPIFAAWKYHPTNATGHRDYIAGSAQFSDEANRIRILLTVHSDSDRCNHRQVDAIPEVSRSGYAGHLIPRSLGQIPYLPDVLHRAITVRGSNKSIVENMRGCCQIATAPITRHIKTDATTRRTVRKGRSVSLSAGRRRPTRTPLIRVEVQTPTPTPRPPQCTV
jgi:hypothetical protein